MCGIVGYIGGQQAASVLVGGLKRLEYRGYDSAGVAILNGDLHVRKHKGKVSILEDSLESSPIPGTAGIGHTRWATHGAPTDANAHPHVARDGRFAIIHNGIIENYSSLKKALQKKGYDFKSETDTEVLAHFIDDVQKETGLPLVEAVRQALTQVRGTYGVVLVSQDEPDQLIAARMGSPLLLGVGEGEHFVASDASPLIEHTRNVVYLEDGEMAVVRCDGYEVMSIDGAPLVKEVHKLEWEIEEIEKGGYEHFMLKEIMEQPEAIANCLRGRIDPATGDIRLGGLLGAKETLASAKRILMCACGTSWHASLVGEYLIEEYARIPVEVDYASEFRYRNPIFQEGDVMIVVSQSGETADTLAALRLAQAAGVPVYGVCNVVGSTIARETDAGVYLHAGPEIGVASTKAFTGQVTVLQMIALLLAKERGTMTEDALREHLEALQSVPALMQQVLDGAADIEKLARDYRFAQNFLYLGRGPHFPVALEGALKLKEISYIHAEGYPAAEMKHGPIALIDQFMPVVFIATKDVIYEKVVSNIEEVAARGGQVIAITNEGNDELDALCEYVIKIPDTVDSIEPLLTVIPLQLLSYHIAIMRSCNVDQPRNLAKSVTVE